MCIAQPYMTEPWFALLTDKVAQSSRNKVAKELGYSLTAISLVMNGKYAGNPDRLRDKVLQQYSTVRCPHQGKTIALHVCQDLAQSPAPTHNPLKMQQWRACQKCPHNQDSSCQAKPADATHA